MIRSKRMATARLGFLECGGGLEGLVGFVVDDDSSAVCESVGSRQSIGLTDQLCLKLRYQQQMHELTEAGPGRLSVFVLGTAAWLKMGLPLLRRCSTYLLISASDM